MNLVEALIVTAMFAFTWFATRPATVARFPRWSGRIVVVAGLLLAVFGPRGILTICAGFFLVVLGWIVAMKRDV
jgi:hypothetical protein